MKICLLCARFPPEHCGIGDYTYFLSKALAESGYEVDVLTSVGEPDTLLYPLCRGLQVHRVVKSWGPRGLCAIFQACRRLRPDVVILQYGPHAFHARGITFAVNLLPFFLRVMTRTQVVTNFHELYVPFTASPKRSFLALWQRAMAFVIAYGSHRLMVTASGWPEQLRRIAIFRRIAVVPVGSNIPCAEIGREERERIRRELLGACDGILIVGFGALHDRDMSGVLEALRHLKAYRPTKLVWIGAERSDLASRHEIRVEMEPCALDDVCLWTGFLPHPKVSKILSACDVVILPFIDGISTRRGSAIAALQHGRSLLTTRAGKVDSFFLHGENIYMVSVGDRQALTRGLLELVGSPEMRARIARGAEKLHQASFAWDVVAAEVVKLCEGG